jgi:hypothetical protein
MDYTKDMSAYHIKIWCIYKIPEIMKRLNYGDIEKVTETYQLKNLLSNLRDGIYENIHETTNYAIDEFFKIRKKLKDISMEGGMDEEKTRELQDAMLTCNIIDLYFQYLGIHESNDMNIIVKDLQNFYNN